MPDLRHLDSFSSEQGSPSRSEQDSPAFRRRSMPAATLPRMPPKQPLEISIVARACEPCGPLLRWIRELVLNFMERRRLQQELDTVEVDLFLAVERLSMAERNASSLGEELGK